MPYILGFLLGDVLNRIGFFRAAAVWLLICATSFVSYQLVAKNVDPALATQVAVVVPVALFAWAVWNPAQHRFRLWIVDGVYLAARIAMWLAVVLFAIILVQVGFRVSLWLERAWTWGVLAAVLWGVQRILIVRVERSHRVAERRAVQVDAA